MSIASRVSDKISHDLQVKNAWAEASKVIAKFAFSPANIGRILTYVPHPIVKGVGQVMKVGGTAYAFFKGINYAMLIAKGKNDGIISSGSQDVIINGLGAARCFSDTAACNKDGVKIILKSNSKVFVNGESAVRAGDLVECGSVVATGSENVFFGDLS